MIGLSTLSGIVALVLWCRTDTSLSPENFRDRNGKIGFWGVLSVLLVQIVLWTLVGFFAFWIVPHLPKFFLTGWRLPATLFVSSGLQWFSLLMILQYVWMIVRPTLSTTGVVALSKLGSQWAKQAINEAPSKTQFVVSKCTDKVEQKQSKEGVGE
jgi:hypothetical protein